jgi:hypothetical protein
MTRRYLLVTLLFIAAGCFVGCGKEAPYERTEPIPSSRFPQPHLRGKGRMPPKAAPKPTDGG